MIWRHDFMIAMCSLNHLMAIKIKSVKKKIIILSMKKIKREKKWKRNGGKKKKMVATFSAYIIMILRPKNRANSNA